MTRFACVLVLFAACSSPRPPATARRDDAPKAEVGSAAHVAVVPGATPGDCAGPACWTSVDGFRFVHPLPAGETLRGVHVMPDGEVWIVGDNAALWKVTRDAKGAAPKITRVTVPDVPTVASIIDDIDGKGAGARDFPGTQLMKLDFESIVARDNHDVWIAIGEQDLLHWDGTSWRHHPYKDGGGEELMFGPDGKLWAAGELGAGIFSKSQHPLVFNGTKLVDGPQVPSDGHIRAIAWQGKDVWVAGFYGLLFKSTAGKPFKKIKMPEERSYDALWLDHDGTNGYLVGDNRVYRREGDGFVEAHEVKGSLNAVYAFGDGEPAWFVGDAASLLEGGAVREVPIDGFAAAKDYVLALDADRFEAVHGRSPDDVWLVGRAGMIAHYDGSKLTELFPRHTEQDIEGLAWLGDDRWLAVAADGALITGSLARGVTGRETSPMQSTDKPRAIATTRAGELILAGCHTEMFKRDKRGTWTKLPKLAGCVRAIAGADADHLWAVGSKDLVDGKAWRLSGGTWTEVPTGMSEHDNLYDVEVAPNGDVWLAGVGALFVAKSGAAKLTRIAKHEHDEYRGISIRAADDVWFATNANEIGSAGTLVHWDGKKLDRFDHLTANFLSAVVALPNGSVWAVGLGGVATYSADGKTFKPAQIGAQVTLDQLIAHPSGALLAAGSFGAILQR